ncbi:PemK-like protein [Teredinibacter turnerae T7901]|uniref:PemK-like protein n=1 Tax=Teredinibacter turnerae (strain ATCC 39867 / T7901) TaxID=377629 RepID=C5BSM1_TERTT|nr:type II toxin-antitoxin system PemK/MazF family toxin [Teredinibacter turnerae]ACR12225.1 PemK-like protein [Teredinibacter turnerae T7901]
MSGTEYVPSRGDIIFTDFHPAAGKEQNLARPALVLSPLPFNKKIGLALVAPITSKIRAHGFEVVLAGTKTVGAVLCHQVKTIDYKARGSKFIEKAPAVIIQDVLAKVRLLV